MACCAFAAFILSQIILGLDALRSHLGIKTGLRPAENPNALWTFGAAPARTTSADTRPFKWAIVTMAAVCAGAVTGAIWFAGDHPVALDSISHWCRAAAGALSQ